MIPGYQKKYQLNLKSNCHRDPKLVERIGAATALEVRATGIPYVFAPTVAVITSNIIKKPITFESRSRVITN